MSVALGAILAAAAGAAVSGGIDIFNNERNIKMQKDTNAQNEALTREAWSREDTAVQRRVADLKAAGLSPTLAAGSAAASGSPATMVAPKSSLRGADLLNYFSAVKSLKLADEQIEGQKIANRNAEIEGDLKQLEVDNYGLPWQLKAINSVLEHLNGKNLFETVHNVYANFQQGPLGSFVTPGSFTFKPSSVSTPQAQAAVDNALSSGAAKASYDSDGSPAIVFESKTAAKQWFLDIGGTTAEWYNGVQKYGSPEEFLNWILGTGGWYFK